MKESKSAVTIPAQGLVYDFVYDFQAAEWKRWLTTVPPYSVNPNINFSQVRMLRSRIHIRHLERSTYLGLLMLIKLLAM